MDDLVEPYTQDAPPLSSIGTHGELIHPKERYFDSEIRYHAEKAVFERLKKLMGAVLWNKLRETVFGKFIDFIERKDWRYKGRLVAFLYFHMVYPDRIDELHFKIGNKRLKFGRREFALIMGFRFGSVDVRIPSTSRCFSQNCELRKFESSVTLKKMEGAFPTADDETKLRMGIVYFVYGVMMGTDAGKIIPRKVFYIVEDLEIVNNFPWGEYLFTNLIGSWCRIVQLFLTFGYNKKEKERPTVSGCLHAMQLWLFHAVPNIASKGEYATLKEGFENALPAFERWKCSEGGLYSKSLNGNRVKPWENIPDDILTNDAERFYVISLDVPETEVRALPRQLPAPPTVDRAEASRPARERAERPDADDEDMPPTQARRTSSSANPRGDHMSEDVGEDNISIVGVLRSDELARVVQPYMAKADDELRRARTELNEMKAELTRSKSEIVALRSELSEVKARAIATSTELSEVKAQLSEAMSEIKAVSLANHRLESRLKKLEREDTPRGNETDAGHTQDWHDDDHDESGVRQSDPIRGGFQSGPSLGTHFGAVFDTPRGNETDAGRTQAAPTVSCEGLSTPGADFDINGIDLPLNSAGPEARTTLQTVLFGNAEISSSSTARVTKGRGRRKQTRIGRGNTGRGIANTIGEGVSEARRNVRSVVRRPHYLRLDSSWVCDTRRKGQKGFAITKRIEDEHMKPLREWLATKGGIDSVPLINGYKVDVECLEYHAGREFFEMLIYDVKIQVEHADAYVGLLRARMEKYPDNYHKHVSLCYSSFTSTLVKELTCWNYDMTVEAPGVLTLETAAWGKKTVAYSIWFVNPVHWLLVVMDIDHWTLTVYDNRSGKGDKNLIDDIIAKWCKYMRILLRTSPDAKSHQMMLDTGERPFDRMNESCSQTNDWKYCGLYALKTMELLIIPKADIHCLDDNKMHMLRKKMAVDLYCRNLDY